MKFLRLVVKNVTRNMRRSILTVTSIAVSVFLIATLLTVLSELQSPPETPDSALRLITRHRVSLANVLPVSYKQKIAGLDGVEAVSGSMWFGGVYKDPSNFFAQFATDTDVFFEVMSDLEVPEDQKQAFLQDRTGALVGAGLMERFGWKIGDRVHLQGTIFSFNPELTIRAVYTGGNDEASSLYFHWDYFNEGLNNASFTGTFTTKARSAEEVSKLAERIDALFQNSTAPTKTESERAFILGFVSMMGNVQLLITSISLVIIFAVVLIAANTMAMSIRERVREIGVLKALGFRRGLILTLLLGESIGLALFGSLLGSWGAKFLYSGVNFAVISAGMIPSFDVTNATLATCAVIGLAVGVLAAGIPAWGAARRPVAEALGRVV